MSKQLEHKKEAALTLKKFYSALENEKPEVNPASESEYRYKYNLLLKRFNELDKVFEFHRGIIQNISSSILTIDMKGNITFINRSALDLFGYNYLDIQGKPMSFLFADKQSGQTIIDRVLSKQVMYESQETYFVSETKRIISIGFSTTLLKDSDHSDPEGVIFIFRDIENVNNLRRQMERMERLATLGELSAGIAHEIRNPLAGIKTSAQVLEESFSPGDFRSQLVSRIIKEIDRSNDLLKRFFNFAKPSKPSQDFHNVEMLIDGVYLLLAPRLKKQNISFKTDFSSDAPLVYVDEGQIEQVILNIFINAAEAIEKGGQIFVETGVTGEIKLHEESEDEMAVYIRISDTGHGIPEEIQEKIFNPFYTSKSDGMGLGLSISSRLLEENGGKMEVESKPGKGTVFSIYLPSGG